MSKAGLFLNNLKHLGFELASGDMTVFIGMKLDLEEIPFNEAIQRFNKAHPDSTLQELSGDYANAKITIPTKIISMPAKKVPLEEKIRDFVSMGKTESEVIAWCNETNTPMVDVFSNLDSKVKDGSLIFEGKTYLAQKEKEEVEK
jgi:hypothetical protein